MRIEKTNAGDYRARPIIDGKKLTVRAKTKGEVARQVATLREQKRNRRLGLPDPTHRPLDVTFDALCEKALAQYPYRSSSRTTLENNLRRARNDFGNVLVHELRPETLQLWIARLTNRKGRELATTTKRNTLKAIRYVLRRGVTWSYLPANIGASVEMPPEPDYKAEPFESWDEVRHVAAQFSSAAHTALVLFASATGLRPQEWQALQWRDLDITARSLHVRRTLQEGRSTEFTAKTSSSLRTVMLDDLALEALRALPTPLRNDQLVFPGRSGGILNLHNWRRRTWKNALSAAEVKYRGPKGMRDTYATLALGDGAPLEWISAQMGHTDIDTTKKHYARWKPTTDYRILDALNRTRSERTGLQSASGNGAAL